MNAIQGTSPEAPLNNWQIARSFVLSPARGFDQLRQNPRNALPLLLLLVGSVVVIQWYFNVVDLGWMKHQLRVMFEHKGQGGTHVVHSLRFISRGMLKWSTTFTTLLTTLFLLALEALYLLLCGMAARIRYSYGQWFAFVCWSATPLIIGLILQLLMLGFGNVSRTDLSGLQPLTLNELFFHAPFAQRGYQLFANVSLLTVAQIGLSIVGLRVWSGRSWAFSTVYMLVPFALYIGTLALMSSWR